MKFVAPFLNFTVNPVVDCDVRCQVTPSSQAAPSIGVTTHDGMLVPYAPFVVENVTVTEPVAAAHAVPVVIAITPASSPDPLSTATLGVVQKPAAMLVVGVEPDVIMRPVLFANLPGANWACSVVPASVLKSIAWTFRMMRSLDAEPVI